MLVQGMVLEVQAVLRLLSGKQPIQEPVEAAIITKLEVEKAVPVAAIMVKQAAHMVLALVELDKELQLVNLEKEQYLDVILVLQLMLVEAEAV